MNKLEKKSKQETAEIRISWFELSKVEKRNQNNPSYVNQEKWLHYLKLYLLCVRKVIKSLVRRKLNWFTKERVLILQVQGLTKQLSEWTKKGPKLGTLTQSRKWTQSWDKTRKMELDEPYTDEEECFDQTDARSRPVAVEPGFNLDDTNLDLNGLSFSSRTFLSPDSCHTQVTNVVKTLRLFPKRHFPQCWNLIFTLIPTKA